MIFTKTVTVTMSDAGIAFFDGVAYIDYMKYLDMAERVACLQQEIERRSYNGIDRQHRSEMRIININSNINK